MSSGIVKNLNILLWTSEYPSGQNNCYKVINLIHNRHYFNLIFCNKMFSSVKCGKKPKFLNVFSFTHLKNRTVDEDFIVCAQ